MSGSEDHRSQNGWGEYKRLVVHELERLNNKLEEMDDHVQKIDRDVLALKIRASVWGAVAGFAVSLIPALFRLLLTTK